MFVKLNKNTGEMVEWNLPVQFTYLPYNGYLNNRGHAEVLNGNRDKEIFVISYDNNSIYQIDLEINKCVKIDIEVNLETLQNSILGFGIATKWFGYSCLESAFNTLKDFLDGNITGNSFNKEEQLENYASVATNLDGTCGKKVNEFIIKNFKG
jgi:hypothetical protein